MGRLTRSAAVLAWVAAVACCSHAISGAWANSSDAGGGSSPAATGNPGSAGCLEVAKGVKLCTSLLPPSSSNTNLEEEVLAAGGVVPNDVPAAWNDTDIETTDAWFLHSRPGAKRTIFLAFGGCITTGTVWNQPTLSVGPNGTATIVTAPYDADGLPLSFSEGEMRDAIDIWRAIAELFSMYDVDVTTEQPAAEKLERVSDDDDEYGMRVCITSEPGEWVLPSMATQVALSVQGSFGRSVAPGAPTFQDAFVFAKNIQPQLNKVWVLIAQQLGFTLGLKPQRLCRLAPDGTTVYTPGSYYISGGGWSPIMNEFLGLAQFNQWSDGTYPGGLITCDPEDQVAIMAQHLPLLPDDAPDSPERALTVCRQTSCSVLSTRDDRARAGFVVSNINGRIHRGNDSDFYTLYATAAGTVNITVVYVPNWSRAGTPFLYRRSTLRLALTSASGNMTITRWSENALTTAWQAFTLTLPSAGLYTFGLTPTTVTNSRAQLNLPTNYGNVGAYSLRVEFPPGMSDFTGSSAATTDAFQLHSRPTAPRKIFLAFQGCITGGGAWSQALNGATVTTPAYDTDGDPTTFSDSERADIAAIHSAVAEDFAIWDVDVTTADPGVEGVHRANPSDINYGIRVCIGGSGADVPGSEEGLVVLPNTFGTSSSGALAYPDALVFSQRLLPRVDRVWNAASKAVGLSMGLRALKLCQDNEDGSKADIDFPGTPGGWGPIMGDLFGDAQFTQWSNGITPSWPPPCNAVNEMAIIGSKLPLIFDTEGFSSESAFKLCEDTNCTGSGTTVRTTFTGITNSGTDTDWFSFRASQAGNAVIMLEYVPNYMAAGAAGPALFHPANLRLQLAFDQESVDLQKAGTFDSVFTVKQSFTAVLPSAGIFSFWVQPVLPIDEGLQLPTLYGNTGRYTITITWPGATTVPDCKPVTNCSPGGGCRGCKCSLFNQCACNRAEGYQPAWRAGTSSCQLALQWPNLINTQTIGYFRARQNRRVRLPWRLAFRGCPITGVPLLTSVSISSNGVACPTGFTPTSLVVASANQPDGFQTCAGGNGYSVFTATPQAPPPPSPVPSPAPGTTNGTSNGTRSNSTQPAKGAPVPNQAAPACRQLVVRTSDGRIFRGVITLDR